jgi:hypothetical protein
MSKFAKAFAKTALVVVSVAAAENIAMEKPKDLKGLGSSAGAGAIAGLFYLLRSPLPTAIAKKEDK